MVPLKLSLRNFMAYRRLDPPLDFSGIHVACLSGPNGAGKSTLLDAMTWALWGQARAKSDDDLVTLGEQEMEVELEIGLGEERYRVIRKRTKPGVRKTGQSVLELQIADPDGFFRPITGNTLRETQRRLEELLRLDYQTFINSAMLLQGRADEFTLKAPGDRKRVLADVLNLSAYDRFEVIARDKSRDIEGEIAVFRGEIGSLEAQVALRPAYEEELQTTREAHDRLSSQVKAQEQTVEGVQERARLRHEKLARLAETKDRAAQTDAEVKELLLQEGELRTRIRQHREALAQKETLMPVLREYEVLTGVSERFNRAFQELYQLRQEENRLERVIETSQGKLAAEESLVKRDMERLLKTASSQESLALVVQQSQAALETLKQQEKQIASGQERLYEISQQLGGLQQTNQDIVRQGQELRAKVEQLSRPGTIGVCPLCGSELGPEGHQRIVAEYEGELQRQRELFRSNDRQIKALQQEQERIQRESRAVEERIGRERASATADLAGAQQGLAEVERSATELVAAQQRLTQLQIILSEEHYAPEERTALIAVQRRVTGLAYDEAEHKRARARLKELEPALVVGEQLQEAERLLPREETDHARVQESLARWQARGAEETARAELLAQELAALPEVALQLAQAQQELASTRERLAQASAAVGRVQALIERCDEMERVLRTRRADILKREHEKSVYDELALAFGRRGIQALLIETVLPELEDEANQLLARMTDNRMHVKLETQRQTRSGSVTETLDINISDELGTRGYELYSGGEAFRINFALRIAISKLLARRAGAPLPTLIIDEGFGTQDAAGKEKLIEVVNAIAPDFERVLVITHIDELKDAFPVRIEVEKTEHGARVAVR